MKLKFLVLALVLAQSGGALAFEVGGFLSNIFAVKAGSKASDTSEGKDLDKFKTPNKCRKLYPWSEPKVKDGEVEKRLLFLCRNSFYLQYDPMLKMPISVSEVLSKPNMLAAEEPKNYKLDIDPDLPASMQGSFAEYQKTGYQMGQLAPAGDMTIYDESLTDDLLITLNKTARTESFYLTNTSPMVSNNFYNGIWRQLETETRSLASQAENLYVTTGPIFLDGQTKGFLGDKRVPIPTHYFKVITDPLKYGSVAYIIPNKEIITAQSKTIANKNDAYYCGEGNAKRYCELGDFVVSIRELERLSGLEFYPILAPYYAVQVKQDINQIFKNKKKRPKLD